MLQGLALGGEYGGAATYVAEHSPQGKRGAYTAWIQTTATLGLFLSLMVILGTRTLIGEAAFADWGWRVPFIVSIFLLAISVWIRLSMNESPAFQKMKAEGRTSKAPLTESFGQWKNLKIVILALIGLTAGQAVVWYSGQFYALFFLTQALKVDGATANILVAVSLLIGTPFFIVFGALSDKIGRKPIIMAGCLLAAMTYFPVFGALTKAANPDLAAAQAKNKVVVTADPAECSFQFNPTGTVKFTSSCDIAKQVLAGASVSYENVAAAPGTVATIKIGETAIPSYSLQGPVRRRSQEEGRRVQEAGRGRPEGRRLPDQGRPGQARQVHGRRDPDVPRDPGHHGLRPDRRHAGGNVPDAHPLHLDEPAVPHRQRLVRRPAAHHRLRHRGADRQHVQRPLVPDHHRRRDLRHRHAVHQGNQGRRHLRA